jgi:hypothetical protein
MTADKKNPAAPLRMTAGLTLSQKILNVCDKKATEPADDHARLPLLLWTKKIP